MQLGISALGQKQTCALLKVMSALPPKADIANTYARAALLFCRCPRTSHLNKVLRLRPGGLCLFNKLAGLYAALSVRTLEYQNGKIEIGIRRACITLMTAAVSHFCIELSILLSGHEPKCLRHVSANQHRKLVPARTSFQYWRESQALAL